MSDSNRPASTQRLLADIIELFELQWQLLAVDTAEAKRGSVRAIIFLVIAAVAGIAGLLAVVLGVGWSIHEIGEMSVGVSFLIVGLAALTLAAGFAFAAIKFVGKANESLSETKRELSENAKWLKAVILQPDTSPRNQIRHNSFNAENVPAEQSRFQHIH